MPSKDKDVDVDMDAVLRAAFKTDPKEAAKVKHYLRLVPGEATSPRLKEVVEELIGDRFVVSQWTPVLELIERENDTVSLRAEQAGFVCDVECSWSGNEGSIRIKGGDCHGDWKILELRKLAMITAFASLYRIKARNPQKGTLWAFVGKDISEDRKINLFG